MKTEDIGRLRDVGAKWLRAKHSLNDADNEDVLQDSLIELVKASNRMKIADYGALLTNILDKRVKDKLDSNKSRLKREIVSGDIVDLSVLSDGIGLTNEQAMFSTKFDAAFRDLPRELQEAFALYELRGLTEYEAGTALGIPPSTVVSRADQARKALRKEV